MNNMIATKTIKTKTKNKKVQIYKLPASEGIVLGTRLLKLILPVLGGFADEMFSEKSESIPNTFSEVAERLLKQMDNVDILAIIKRLLEEAAVDGAEINFDEYFMSNYGELISITEFALRENFESFFEIAGLKDRLFQAIAGVTEPQAESDD